MCMELNRKAGCFFQRRYKFCCFVRKKQSCHIFNADRICTHFFNFFCFFHPVIQRVGVSNCIGKSHLGMCFLFVCCFYSCPKIPKVIQTVENTDDINSVCNGFLHKVLYYIIAVRTVSKDVLSTEKHLKLCIFKSVTAFTESVPWILFQETQGSIKGCPAPAFHGMISDFVKFFYDRHHLLGRHSCCDQGLMCITQNRLCYFNWFFLCHFNLLLELISLRISP